MPGIGPRWAWRCAGLFALVGLLLTGCHSQQATFSFRPAPVAATLLPTATDTVPGPPLLQASIEPAPAAPVRTRLGVFTSHSATTAINQAETRSAAPVASRQQPQKALRRSAKPQDREHDTLHLVLGGLLIVGGILAGLLLGGWLGLGVGALIVVLGYYFLVMGIGGSHAWREVFQEFFNM
ncbi:hypothetical protein HER32_08855 [Hymenobacter sp. BT18]|uniref:hypothetical protein n=1 Tax=Hymenobacter sp. BT18 TaxID=2835648 RepID=UPI00143E2C29|nr:hypothetical protein [Hymenobacter sp. BT18]QIX61283.1 hypothetical protein HER32_08855 [Hymenobacter sp. BT18]